MAVIFARSSLTVVLSSLARDDQYVSLEVRGVGFYFLKSALPFFRKRAVALFLGGIMIRHIEV